MLRLRREGRDPIGGALVLPHRVPVRVCETTVSFVTAFVREVTWVEPHRLLFVIVAEMSFGVEWNSHVPHVDHWFDNPSFESAWGVKRVHAQLDQLSV